MLLGWGLLSLPIAYRDEPPSGIDNLFIALSAVTTTGLTTVPIATTYSTFGHVVIFLLMQIGGIGYMTVGSFAILASRKELPGANEDMVRVVYDLPEGLSTKKFVRNVILFTLGIELIGFLLLWLQFANAGVELSAWQALFHSVSAFCTSGLSLFPNSLEGFRDHTGVTTTIGLISLVGAAGFLVVTDFISILNGGKQRESLTTTVILGATVACLALGTVLLFWLEPSYQQMSWWGRLQAATFQSASALATVGFHTTAMSGLGNSAVFLMLLLMIFGSSPAGTGGGIRITAVAAAVSATWTTIRQRKRVTLANRRIPQHRLNSAFVSIVFYIALVFAGAITVMTLWQGPFDDILFEVVSAVSTVGLSRGITADLSGPAKVVFMVLMFIGRIGPISLGSAAFARDPETPEKPDEPEEDLAVD